jgi:hypothetical protein
VATLVLPGRMLFLGEDAGAVSDQFAGPARRHRFGQLYQPD